MTGHKASFTHSGYDRYTILQEHRYLPCMQEKQIVGALKKSAPNVQQKAMNAQ